MSKSFDGSPFVGGRDISGVESYRHVLPEPTMTRLLLALPFVLACDLAAIGQPPAKNDPPAKGEPPPTHADAGTSAYKIVLRSTVWVHSDRGNGRLATGSGALVDRGRRLVLTNYHVVGDVKKATVYFPDYGSDKKAISERKHYTSRAGKLGIAGDVIEVDKEGDLALIRIDRVPDGVPALKLAASSPDPGQTVHSIGNPGKSGALWVYTPGKVRQVYSKKWRAKLDEKTIHTFQAKVIETDSPTNPGDSGGPLVNDQGELVGVTQGGAIDAQSLSIFVDLSEVKRIINRRSVQALRSSDTSTSTSTAQEPPKQGPEKSKREAALKSKDEGGFFSQEAWMRVQPAAEKLFKEKKIDLLVETYKISPKGDVAKLKAMSAAERESFYKEFTGERAKELGLEGIYVFVCRSPAYVYVGISHSLATKVPSGFSSIVSRKMIAQFQDKKYDEGLKDAIEVILESIGLQEKEKK
jgi:S1-C subfamily serine protease